MTAPSSTTTSTPPAYDRDGTIRYLQYGRGQCTLLDGGRIESCLMAFSTDASEIGAAYINDLRSIRPDTIVVGFYDDIESARAALAGTETPAEDLLFVRCAGFTDETVGAALTTEVSRLSLDDRGRSPVAGPRHRNTGATDGDPRSTAPQTLAAKDRDQIMDRLLVLVRHGQSEWNLKNLFTGWRDVGLSEQGVEEAKAAGQRLKGENLKFGVCFTSALTRAQRTLDLMLEELGQTGLPITRDQALNERDYGDLSGLNKDDARAKWGEEQVHIWRRSYATQPPGGESLRDTGARVWPYYIHRIQPHVMRGEGVLIAAHGNSLRALIMALDGLTPDEVVKLELPTGLPVLYRLNADTTSPRSGSSRVSLPSPTPWRYAMTKKSAAVRWV